MGRRRRGRGRDQAGEDQKYITHFAITTTGLTYLLEHGLTTAEAVTLAQQLVNHKKTRTELINEGFNRYSLNAKDGLPSWFLDDEQRYYKANIPVTKEAVAALRAKMRALDARPIKKVAEAKARKKMKAAQRFEKALKKAEGVTEMSDMTEREKAKQIEKLMAKGTSTKKAKKDIKVVVAKGAHRGLKGRPKGVKGRYVMVDSRMKKEVGIPSLLFCASSSNQFSVGSRTKAERKGSEKAQTELNVLTSPSLRLYSLLPHVFKVYGVFALHGCYAWCCAVYCTMQLRVVHMFTLGLDALLLQPQLVILLQLLVNLCAPRRLVAVLCGVRSRVTAVRIASLWWKLVVHLAFLHLVELLLGVVPVSETALIPTADVRADILLLRHALT